VQHPSEYNPFFAKVVENKRITSADHFQDTRHIVLDTEASQFEHMPGDVLAICPLTPWESVDAFLKRIGVDPRSFLSVRVISSNAQVLCFARSLVQGECRLSCKELGGLSQIKGAWISMVPLLDGSSSMCLASSPPTPKREKD